jgi:hypothetical protein
MADRWKQVGDTAIGDAYEQLVFEYPAPSGASE